MQYVSWRSTCGRLIMAAMSLQSGMISEPPVNVNDSDHSEPARLSVFAHSPGVTHRVARFKGLK